VLSVVTDELSLTLLCRRSAGWLSTALVYVEAIFLSVINCGAPLMRNLSKKIPRLRTDLPVFGVSVSRFKESWLLRYWQDAHKRLEV
jgi:hypothetical protein